MPLCVPHNAKAIEQLKRMRIAFTGYMKMDNDYIDKSLTTSRGILIVGLTTRLECMVGRALVKFKNKKAGIQRAKTDFESRTGKDPSTLVLPDLWKLADQELQ